MELEKKIVQTCPVDNIKIAVMDYELIIITILDALLDRYERNPGYHFIDTKLNISTGEDFPEPEDDSADFKGRTAIFSWIQGRGLEALVGHAKWLPSCSILSQDEIADRLARIKVMVREVFENMEGIREKNEGHLFFMLSPDGRVFDIDESGRRRYKDVKEYRSSHSDLFYVKGMLSAAKYLDLEDKVAEARIYFQKIIQDMVSERFLVDQISFDPKNKVINLPGCYSVGPRMITIGAFALFAELLREEEWYEGGEAFVNYIINKHINLGRYEALEKYDFFEIIDEHHNPCADEGRILSDPGHCLEFIGLAAKFLLILKEKPDKTPSQIELLSVCRDILPKVMIRNFNNGWNEKVGGICKLFDLVGRKPVNTDMPWWPLPESIRSVAELLALYPDLEERAELLEIINRCSDAFTNNFINRDVHLMAYQTIDTEGRPVETIPATPDADPGYHTGLSLIDFINCW